MRLLDRSSSACWRFAERIQEKFAVSLFLTSADLRGMLGSGSGDRRTGALWCTEALSARKTT
jgi:hypothetical protein